MIFNVSSANGKRIYRGVAGYNRNRLLNYEFVPRGFLFDKARLAQYPEKLRGAAIRRRQLWRINFDSEIIYFKGINSGQAMLDGFDADRAFFYGGSACSFPDIQGNGPDANRLRQIGADENHACFNRGGAKNNRRLLAAKQALAANGCRGCYRLLQFQVFPPLRIIV